MSYLERYGEGVERRLRLTRRVAAAVVCVLAAAVGAWLLFGNYRQEQQAKRFVDLLARGQYDAAYTGWVHSDSERRAYPMAAFLEDWGPASGRGDAAPFRVAKSRSCGSGVIVTVRSARREERLWVERKTLTIGFAPPLEGLPRICGM